MNSHVFQIDQRIFILVTMNKHQLQPLLLCFGFTHAEYNLIKSKLYNNYALS